MPTGRLLRLCIAVWLFAFLAGASYAVGPSPEGPKVAQRSSR
ncbi:MAG TPA: hypothetical protein VLM85_01390 [Polyangiaceae bacterium]|nr:hypothetical protein [Polyangiaceae bacterium]